jgi:hypothetical protein
LVWIGFVGSSKTGLFDLKFLIFLKFLKNQKLEKLSDKPEKLVGLPFSI